MSKREKERERSREILCVRLKVKLVYFPDVFSPYLPQIILEQPSVPFIILSV